MTYCQRRHEWECWMRVMRELQINRVPYLWFRIQDSKNRMLPRKFTYVPRVSKCTLTFVLSLPPPPPRNRFNCYLIHRERKQIIEAYLELYYVVIVRSKGHLFTRAFFLIIILICTASFKRKYTIHRVLSFFVTAFQRIYLLKDIFRIYSATKINSFKVYDYSELLESNMYSVFTESRIASTWTPAQTRLR